MSMASIPSRIDARTGGRGYSMCVRLPVFLVVLKYVDPPSTARIRLTVGRVGRRGVFEGIKQVLREGEDYMI